MQAAAISSQMRRSRERSMPGAREDESMEVRADGFLFAGAHTIAPKHRNDEEAADRRLRDAADVGGNGRAVIAVLLLTVVLRE